MTSVTGTSGAQAPKRTWRLRCVGIYGAMSVSFRRLRLAIPTANPQPNEDKKRVHA
jgi:hypothetical protein